MLKRIMCVYYASYSQILNAIQIIFGKPAKKKNPCLNTVLRKLSVNKAVSEIACAHWSFIFACGIRIDPPSQRSAHKCLYGK